MKKAKHTSDDRADKRLERYNCHKRGYYGTNSPDKEKNERGHFKREYVDVTVVFDSYKSVRVLVALVSNTQRSWVCGHG